jgi:hypothetical protein
LENCGCLEKQYKISSKKWKQFDPEMERKNKYYLTEYSSPEY